MTKKFKDLNKEINESFKPVYDVDGPLVTVYRGKELIGMMHLKTACRIHDMLGDYIHIKDRLEDKGTYDGISFKWSKWNNQKPPGGEPYMGAPIPRHKIRD